MSIQELKILPQYFAEIMAGNKTFEVRSVKDRSFNVGETIWLKEFFPGAGYSGRGLAVRVTYILDDIIYNGDPAVVMSIVVIMTKGVAPYCLEGFDIPKAHGEQLDRFGDLLGLKRDGNECDGEYRLKLVRILRGVSTDGN